MVDFLLGKSTCIFSEHCLKAAQKVNSLKCLFPEVLKYNCFSASFGCSKIPAMLFLIPLQIYWQIAKFSPETAG